jgi:hypothetical protein
MTNMARSDVSAVLEVTVEGTQLEFLENKAKQLGLSREELAKLYIAKAIDVEREESQFSLEGLSKEGLPITDKDIEEVIKEWNKTELL